MIGLSPPGVLDLGFAGLSLALVLTTLRLFRGPTLPDRVVALELISMISVGLIFLVAIEVDKPVLVDVAIVVALIAFIGTVAFAYYMERGTPQ